MSQSQAQQDASQQPSLIDLVDHLTRFEGPPDLFLMHLLAVQCHISSSEGGAILRLEPKGNQLEPRVVAVYPTAEDEKTTPLWLAHALEALPAVLESQDTSLVPVRTTDDLYDQESKQHVVMIPLRGKEGVRGVVAFMMNTADRFALDQGRQRLELTVPLLSLYEMRLTLQSRQLDLQKLRSAMEVLASINEHQHFKAAAMALCNEIASVWQADRVSLGFIKGRYICVAAMSHTEKFTRKMKLVIDIESAMEECFDQDVEVIHPASAEATYVSRATAVLGTKQGPHTVISVPLRQNQQVVGVLSVERSVDLSFDVQQIEALRLVAELCTARLDDLHANDKWIGAKMALQVRQGAAMFVGPEHTWVKAAVVGVFLLTVFFTFAKGTDYAEGSFTIEAVQRRVISSPFDGFLERVFAQPNKLVKKGDLLGAFDIRDLRQQRAGAVSERIRSSKAVDTYYRASDAAQRQMAVASVQKATADIKRLDQMIAKARLVAPIDGTVTQGDWIKTPGKPFKTGDVIFEVAPIKDLRAQVYIPEGRVADLQRTGKIYRNAQGQLVGELASASDPGKYYPFTVDRINPIMETRETQNIVRVRVQFDKQDPQLQKAIANRWLKPGVEGNARIAVGRARYLWLWTREMVYWVRMKLWI